VEGLQHFKERRQSQKELVKLENSLLQSSATAAAAATAAAVTTATATTTASGTIGVEYGAPMFEVNECEADVGVADRLKLSATDIAHDAHTQQQLASATAAEYEGDGEGDGDDDGDDAFADSDLQYERDEMGAMFGGGDDVGDDDDDEVDVTWEREMM